MRVTDISTGGVGFESNYPLPMGQHVEFEIPVPIRVKAAIVRAEVGQGVVRYGGRFDGMSDSEQIVLRAYLKSRLEKQGGPPPGPGR